MEDAWFRPMGLWLRLRSDHRAVLDVAEGAFRGFGPAVAAPDAAPDFDFLFLVRDRAERAGEGEPPPLAARGGRLLLRWQGSALIADLAKGRAWGRFTPALLADPARLRLEFLELALQLMLPCRGFFGVHGAALVRGGRAALLRAGGGGGKTTLAYAAAVRGRLQVLAEDVVWIDAARGAWWGLPWWLYPRPEARELFPELAGSEPALRRGGSPKLAVEVESIRPGSAVPHALSGPVVLIRRRPRAAASRLTALALPAAVDLWAAGRAGTEEDVPDYHLRVRRLLAGNAWKLDLGGDLDGALALIEDLLAGAGPAAVGPGVSGDGMNPASATL
ncbi:MAG TPA: hypothetical protein VE075_09380 [Thermoanaerobaculia bacterium]|nr:hypothetical protein [Thermoanaerobaculia bacterium]